MKVGIGTGIHYPIPLHLQKAYTALNHHRGDFPAAEKAAAEIISLPMFPQLLSEQQARVAEEILRFVAHTAMRKQAAHESVGRLVTAGRSA